MVAIDEPLAVAPREAELYGRVEPTVVFGALIRERLPYTLADRDLAALELDGGDGDAVDVEDEVRASGLLSLERDLLSDGEVVVLGGRPVDVVDVDGLLTRRGFVFVGVFEEAVDVFVDVIEVLRGLIRSAHELKGSLVDRPLIIASLGEVRLEERLLDVAVLVAGVPVAEVVVPKLVSKEGEDAVLGLSFCGGLREASYESNPPCEELMHHALFELSGLVELFLERVELIVHVGEDLRDRLLLIDFWWGGAVHLSRRQMSAALIWRYGRSHFGI